VSSGTAKEKTGKSWFTNRLWIADSLEMAEAAKAFGVELVHVFCAGGPAVNQPCGVTTFSPPIGAPLSGAVVSLAPIYPRRSTLM
jgi:hypothetical protein